MSEKRICAVTGTTGYVGSCVAGALEGAGWSVRPLTRPTFQLGQTPPPDALAGASALVHCAWDLDARSWDEIERVNVEGTRRLLDAAAAAGVPRLVFVSTLSAFPGARSMYGRAKLAVEAEVLGRGGAVVRPGLVWGDPGRSLYGTLARLAAALPVLPLFTDRRLHLAHEDDLARLIVHLVEAERVPTRPVVGAAIDPLPLGEILRRAAAVRGRRVRTVSIPWRLVWGGLRALELVRLRPPFRSDSVVSLVSLEEEPLASAEAPETAFRPFAPGPQGRP